MDVAVRGAGHNQAVALRTRLRQATRTLHDDIEAATELPQSLRTPEDVTGWLTRQHRVALALERMAAQPPGLSRDLGSALMIVGRPPASELDDAVAPTASASPGWRGGVHYVLLGSRAGLAAMRRTITRLFPALDGHPAFAVRSHDELRGVLGGLADEPADEVIEGARQAFLCARTILGDQPWRTPS